jgi:adenosylmethionine-8-amino-7-oxononanoate aminotransferase
MSDDIARHLMIDFVQMKQWAEDPLILDCGEGIRVTDDRGRTYIDGLSGVFTSNLGHGNRAIADAMTAQLHRLAFGAPTLATNTRAVELVERLRRIIPAQYTTMKFLSGGSEATEAAIKMARQYHKQTGHPGKYKVLSHYRGYHGGTGNSLAASGWAQWKEPYEPFPAGFIHLQTPDSDQAPFPAGSVEEAGEIYARLAQQTIELEGPETIAAFITEPIMMSAGIITPPDSYLRAIRALCDKHRVVLIYDEIITGFGRTGTWFGAEHSGAWPDIICCGKGITGGYSPLSCVFLTREIAEVFWGEPEERVQYHAGHTYGANPVSCAAALAALDYMEKNDVVGNSARVGSYLADCLRSLVTRHDLVDKVRGRGMLQGLVVGGRLGENPSTANLEVGIEIRAEARARGMLLRTSPWFVGVAPPLVTTPAEVDEIVGILNAAIAVVEEKLVASNVKRQT